MSGGTISKNKGLSKDSKGGGVFLYGKETRST